MQAKHLGVATLLAAVSLAAFAQDPEVMLRHLEAALSKGKFTVEWRILQRMQDPPLTDEKLKIDGPSLVKWADGEIIFARTNRDKVRSNYRVQIDRMNKFSLQTNNRLKSTTCQNVRADLNCKINFSMPMMNLSVREEGQTSGGRSETLNLFGVGPQFVKKHFPDYAASTALTLKCNHWDWLKPGVNSVNIVEGGSVINTQIYDLNVSQNAQENLISGRTCPDKNGQCDISDILYGSRNAYFSFISDQFSWFLEVQDNDGACTVEFQAENVSNLVEEYEQKRKIADPKLSTPAKLLAMNRAISPAMLKEWSNLKIAIDSSGLGDSVEVSQTYLILREPLLKFLDLVDAGQGSFSQGKHEVYLRDKFDPEQEN